MGIVELDQKALDSLIESSAQKATYISLITNELETYLKAHPDVKKVPYEVSSFLVEIPENERYARTKSIATQIQGKLRIRTLGTMDNGHFYIVVDKTKKIEQPAWLKDKQKKRTKQ